MLEAVEEEAAVGEAGEGVVERLVLGPLLRATPLNRVGEDIRDRLHEVDVLLGEPVMYLRACADHAEGLLFPLIRTIAALFTPCSACSSDCWKRVSVLQSLTTGALPVARA